MVFHSSCSIIALPNRVNFITLIIQRRHPSFPLLFQPSLETPACSICISQTIWRTLLDLCIRVLVNCTTQSLQVWCLLHFLFNSTHRISEISSLRFVAYHACSVKLQNFMWVCLFAISYLASCQTVERLGYSTPN